MMTISALFLVLGGFYFWQSQSLRRELKQQEKNRIKKHVQMRRRMYELAITKELGDRIGYSLNIENIVDIISGSLNQFIKFSAVSYMLIEPEKIIFKIHLEQSVSRDFIDEVKKRMITSLSALLEKKLPETKIEEVLSGAILVDDIDEPIRSYFNIPLVIADKVVGVLTVSHTKAGLYQEEEMTILYKIIKQASQAVTKLQEVVKTEQSKLNAMVESMAEGVIMTDKDMRVIIANPAARSIIGLKPEEEPNIFNIIDKFEGKFAFKDKLEESIKLDKPQVFDDVLLDDNIYKILIAPVKSDFYLLKNEILGGVVIFHDITKEKELEKMREDFTSMMVHELRSPLDGIKKISQELQEDYVKNDKSSYEEFVKLIFNNSSRMLEMVNDLLDAAKLEAGKFEIEKESTDIKKIIEDRYNFYKLLADEAKVNIELYFANDLPKKIEVDPNKISQALNNLISNSVKFNKDGGKIFLQAFLHKFKQNINQEAKGQGIKWFDVSPGNDLQDFPSAVIISVTDTGQGISEKNQDKLFNKFKQFAATAKGEKKGTGLGLVIAKGIIEAHGGRIGVGSVENEGSTFFLAVPFKINKK